MKINSEPFFQEQLLFFFITIINFNVINKIKMIFNNNKFAKNDKRKSHI